MEVVGAGDLDVDNPSERLFVFHESASTLQQIASHTVALQLWNNYLNRAKSRKMQANSRGFFAEVFNLGEDFEREAEKLPELLKTPQRIEEMLKESLKKIYPETTRWINDFDSTMFTCDMSRYRLRNYDPNHIVWHQNGKIDSKRTASKMLTEGKLNAEQKFILMCAYGMAEELERFPMNSLPELFQWLGISNLKVGYWICNHRDDLRKIWLRSPQVINNQDTSMHVIMAKQHAIRPFPDAFEYFWGRLSVDDQLLVAIQILHRCGKLQKTILSKMSPFQQRWLADRIPGELWTNFCTDCDMPENAFIIWTRIKDRITEQQFANFLNNMMYHVVHSEKSMIMLSKVWDTASDRLKRHIVEINPGVMLRPIIACEEYSPSGYRLVMKLLPLVNENTRKQLIYSITEGTVVWTQNIDFLNLCLPEEADQLRLKNLIMESESMVRYCANKLNCLDFDDVINTLAFFSRSARDNDEFFKKLLEGYDLDAVKFILDYKNWNKLNNFIDTVFANNLSTIPELKKQVVSCFSARAVHCFNDEKENLNVLVKITEQVFSTEEMKTFKKILLEHFRKMISTPEDWFDFRGKCYNAFVTWCSDDESRIIDFKNIVPIDEFFDEIFRTICSDGNTNPEMLLKELDMYLRCFCSSEEEVKLLKIRKYYERDQYWIQEVSNNFPRQIRLPVSDWFRSSENEVVFPTVW